MKRKLFMSFVAVALMLFSISTVSAATTYNIGDLITVALNDNDTEDFYVIEDKGDYVVAIAKNTVGKSTYFYENPDPGVFECYTSGTHGVTWDTSTIKTNLGTATATWTNASEVRLLNVDDLEHILGKDLSSNTTSAVNEAITHSFLQTSAAYWTMEIAIYQPNGTLCDVWLINGSTLTQSSGCHEMDVKPVIEIDKDHIEETENPGGTTNPTDNPNLGTPVDNPQTGNVSNYVFGGFLIIGLLSAAIIFKKKNYFVKL